MYKNVFHYNLVVLRLRPWFKVVWWVTYVGYIMGLTYLWLQIWPSETGWTWDDTIRVVFIASSAYVIFFMYGDKLKRDAIARRNRMLMEQLDKKDSGGVGW